MNDNNKISFFSAVMMSMNVMIGAGIFLAVGSMTSVAGSISFLGWSLIALLLFPVILGLSKAAYMFPGDGGFYNYCSKGINPVMGVIAQWVFILGYFGVAASLLTVLRNGLTDAFDSNFLKNYPFIFNLLAIAFYSMINLIPVSKIGKLQSIGTLLKITPLITVIVIMSFFYKNINLNLAEINNLNMTFSTVIFSYLGFEACCSIGGLLKGGPQKVGKVVLTAFSVTTVLYTLFHVGLLYIMGEENLKTYGAMGFPQFLGLPPKIGAAMQVGISFAILFSWANSVLSLSLANVSNLFTLAENKLILGDRFLTKMNNNQRPFNIVLAYGIILFGYVTFVKDINILFALTNLCIGVALFLTMLAVFLTSLKQKNYGQLVVPILSFGSCAMWFYYSLLQIPHVLYIVPILAVLSAAVGMYKIQKGKEESIIIDQA
jgi:amino acid transporter